MSIKLISQAFDLDLSPSEKIVLLVIANYANEHNRAWPSVPTIAEKASLSERQTRRLIHQLEDAGYLEAKGRKKYFGRLVNEWEVTLLSDESGSFRVTHSPDNMSGGGSVDNSAPPDTHDRRPLTPVSPKPLENRSVDTSYLPEETSEENVDERIERLQEGIKREWRENMFKAMYEEWSGEPYVPSSPLPRTVRARINAAVKEAIDAEIGVAQYRDRARRYKQKFPNVANTPQAILGNWAALSLGSPKRATPPPEPEDCPHPTWANLGDDLEMCVVCHLEQERVL